MKKLITVAVAAAILPVSVMASGPVLYGKIHMSVAQIDNDAQAGATEYKSLNLASNSSRIGVKGSEDLGNGITVGYLMEWSVGMDGGPDLGARNRGITISGGMGTILLGRWDTPMKSLGRAVDLFGDRTGDIRQLTRYGTQIDNRQDNVIAYLTPNMAGFNAAFAYVTDVGAVIGRDGTGDDTDLDALSATIAYTNGPAYVGIGYTKVMALEALGAVEEADFRIAGSYKIGAMKIVAGYTKTNDGGGAADNDFSVWQVGGAYGFGSNTLKLQYADKSDGVSGDDDGASILSVGLDHAMSKRTSVYAEYTRTDNDAGAAVTLASKGGAGYGVINGGADSTPTAFAVGIIHKF